MRWRHWVLWALPYLLRTTVLSWNNSVRNTLWHAFSPALSLCPKLEISILRRDLLSKYSKESLVHGVAYMCALAVCSPSTSPPAHILRTLPAPKLLWFYGGIQHTIFFLPDFFSPQPVRITFFNTDCCHIICLRWSLFPYHHQQHWLSSIPNRLLYSKQLMMGSRI